MSLDDPRLPSLLKRGWSLAGQWAAEYLETHPEPSQTELDHIFDGFAPEPKPVKFEHGYVEEPTEYSFSGKAISVGLHTYVVEAAYTGIDFPTGTFMVVARNKEGHFEALWNIKDLAEKHYAQRDEIGWWYHLVRRAYYNGPLEVADVIPLATSSAGHVRFMVNAVQGADGGTGLGQVSVWEWDGVRSIPLLVDIYYFYLDGGGLYSDGTTFQFSTKEQLRTYMSCGGCPEPQGIWTIQITPTGVINQGHKFIQPEFKWADDLLARISDKKDASGLAKSPVIRCLRNLLDEPDDQTQNSDTSGTCTGHSFGLLDHLQVLRRGHRGEFVLFLDGLSLHFNYVLRHGQPYFTRVIIRDA